MIVSHLVMVRVKGFVCLFLSDEKDALGISIASDAYVSLTILDAGGYRLDPGCYVDSVGDSETCPFREASIRTRSLNDD